MYIQTKQLWKCNQYHRFPLLGLHNHCGQWLQPWNQKTIASSDGRKAMTSLHSVSKSRDIPLPTKVHIVKAVVFPVVMYDCDSWTIKKAEHQRIDTFELWYWRRLLKVPWIARRSNKSILREINPEYSLEELMLKLKLQCFGHLMSTNNSLEKSLMLGKLEGRRRRECQRMRWLDGITGAMNMNSDKLWDMVRARQAWCAAVHRVAKSQTQPGNWTATTSTTRSIRGTGDWYSVSGRTRMEHKSGEAAPMGRCLVARNPDQEARNWCSTYLITYLWRSAKGQETWDRFISQNDQHSTTTWLLSSANFTS